MHAAPSTSGTAVYPVGPAFHAHARRILNNRSFQEDDKLERERLAALGNGDEVEDDVDADLGGEDEDEDLLELDPKRWKDQDHYAVLGLQHLRYKADQEQIKKARESRSSLCVLDQCSELTHAPPQTAVRSCVTTRTRRPTPADPPTTTRSSSASPRVRPCRSLPLRSGRVTLGQKSSS